MFRSFFCILFLMSMSSDVLSAPGEGAPGLAGVGGLMATSPYAGVKTKTTVIPFLSGEYKNFYLYGIEAGYRLFKNENWRISAVISPRLMGYDSGDSDTLSGMQDRRMSLDGGLKAEYELPWHKVVVGGKVMADMLSRSDGIEYELALRRPIQGKIFRLIPSAGVRYQTKSMVDYYYGVRDNEARAGRAAYEPRGSLNPFANLVLNTGLSRNVIIVTMFGVESLGSDIRKSPIVDESYVVTAAAGLTYRF
jgi:outer membrane protein